MRKVFFNGNVLTMDSEGTKVNAFVVDSDRFSAVGSDAQILKMADSRTEKIDLEGRTVVPGFIESHSHLSIYATNLMQVDCSYRNGSGIEEVMAQIRAKAEACEPGQWVRGFGYDDTLIREKRHLTIADLDDASPHNPVYVSHITGHISYVNSMALKMAGIESHPLQPSGAHIDLDQQGRPNGILLEPGAMSLVSQLIPNYSIAEFKAAIPEAIKVYHKAGITSTHDAAIGINGDETEILAAYRELENESKLNIRVYLTIVERVYNSLFNLGLGHGFGSEYLKLGSVKLFQDGSIQALTGALNQVYHNRPDYRGDYIYPQEDLNKLVEKYHSAGFQLAIHANGDRAIESVLQALESACSRHPQLNQRHMIIHCQMPSKDQIVRMGRLGVIPNFFVNHVYYWGDRHVRLFLGPERADRIDPLGDAVRCGLKFALHSDLPVTPVDPIFSIHCAVNRMTREGRELGSNQKISPLEALKAYTTNAALCSFEEQHKGTIQPGKMADFAVLSDDPLAVPPAMIKDIRVLQTHIGGRIVYKN